MKLHELSVYVPGTVICACINELSMNCELCIFTILEPESELQTQICSLCLRESFSLKDSNTQFTCD